MRLGILHKNYPVNRYFGSSVSDTIRVSGEVWTRMAGRIRAVARRYRVIIEQDEDGVYIATAPALPGVVEQGNTVDEAFANMGAAMRFTLESMAEEGEELPSSDAPASSREIRNIELAV